MELKKSTVTINDKITMKPEAFEVYQTIEIKEAIDEKGAPVKVQVPTNQYTAEDMEFLRAVLAQYDALKAEIKPELEIKEK